MAAPAWSPTPISKAATARSIPTSRRDAEGLRKLFRQFSFPGGIPSHAAPETPGSIHEGGELGYALVHAYGAAFDNPDLIVACVVGDGEAETGPLAASWHSNKFLNPAHDGAVLPILHLNGYKIANPTVLGRMRDEEIRRSVRGLWPRAAVRRGRRSESDAPADGGRAGRRARQHPRRSSSTRATAARARAAAMADDRAAQPEGLDRPEGSRRQEGRGFLARASGAGRQLPRQSGASARCSKTGCAAIEPEELFDANGALDRRTAGARARRQSPHGRQSARQWRPAEARAEAAGFPRFAVEVPRAGRRRSAKRPASWASSCARSSSLNADDAQLPHHGPGRDRLKPARCGVRGDRSRLDGGDRTLRRPSRRRTVA